MTWDFRFSCTGCGKCCTSAPSLFLNEIIDQAGDILFRPVLRFEQAMSPYVDMAKQLEKRGLPTDPESAKASRAVIVQRQKTYGTPVRGKIYGEKAIAYLSITDLAADHIGQCPFRSKDMSCDIYETRPIVCRAVPVTDFPRGSALKASLEKFVSRPGFACDSSETAKPLVEKGKLVSEEAKEHRAQLSRGRPGEDLSWIPKATKAAIAYFEALSGLNQVELMHEVFSIGVPEGTPVPFGIVVLGMIDSGHIDRTTGMQLLSLQMDAVEKMRLRLTNMGVIDREAPASEAVQYGLFLTPVTWGGYLDRHVEVCRLFHEILEKKMDRKEAMDFLLEISIEMASIELEMLDAALEEANGRAGTA